MSLSPSKKVKYTPKPGNPNLLVPIEEEEEEEEEQLPEKNTPPPPLPIDRDPTVVEFENFLSPLLAQALAPLYTFIGYLEAESGKRIYYRYDPALSLEQKMNPLVKGAVTMEEFKMKNAHLGPIVANLIHEQKRVVPVVIKKEKLEARIGLSVDQFRALYRQLINPNATELHYQVFPVALWDILPTSTFQFLIEKNTFGAMDMSAKELELDLKLLIISDKVNHKFAQFVCKKFISPKQNAFASGISGGNMQYRIASGFNTSVASNTKSLLGARLWFKDVILVDNPALRELEPRLNLLYGQLQDIYSDQLAVPSRAFNGFPRSFKDMDNEQFRHFEETLIERQLVSLKNDFVRMKYEYENVQMSVYPKVYWR